MKLSVRLKNENGVYVPYFIADNTEIPIKRCVGYTLTAQANDQRPTINLELRPSTDSSDDYSLTIDESKTIDKIIITVNGIQYDLQTISYLKYMKMVEALKSIWSDLSKDIQNKFIHIAVEHGNYAALERYLTA